ncbi:hypothetical protein DN069_16280, partial [Streptacidiphilus pinicola]
MSQMPDAFPEGCPEGGPQRRARFRTRVATAPTSSASPQMTMPAVEAPLVTIRSAHPLRRRRELETPQAPPGGRGLRGW